MFSKIVILLIAALASTEAGLIRVSPKFLEGPSSKTTLIGPDGSKIDAYAPGGKVLLEENIGPLLQGAPVVIEKASVAESDVVSSMPIQMVIEEKAATQSLEVVTENAVSVATENKEAETTTALDVQNDMSTERASEQTTVSEKIESEEVTTMQDEEESFDGHYNNFVQHVPFVVPNIHYDDHPFLGHGYAGGFDQQNNFDYLHHHY